MALPLTIAINKAANKALDAVAAELNIDRKLIRASSNFSQSTGLINIEVYRKGMESIFYTANPETLELTKIDAWGKQ